MTKTLDWRNVKKGWPYKGINDSKYKKDKNYAFKNSGNGWWWGWTKLNTPIPGIYTSKDNSIEEK